MALELQQGAQTKVSIIASSRREKSWIKVFNCLSEAEVGSTSESKESIDLKKLKEHLGAKDTSSKKVGFFYFGVSFWFKTVCFYLIKEFGITHL